MQTSCVSASSAARTAQGERRHRQCSWEGECQEDRTDQVYGDEAAGVGNEGVDKEQICATAEEEQDRCINCLQGTGAVEPGSS